MSADKEKQAIRLKKVYQRIYKKKIYTGLNKLEKKYVKMQLRYIDLEKDLNRFWATAPRDSSGAVDWNVLDEVSLDLFHFIFKEYERIQKVISKLEDNGIDGDYIIKVYNQLNNHSQSFC